MFLFEYLPYWFVRLADVLRRTPEAYPLYHWAQVSICFLVMFVPTVCLGMTLPLASRIATEEVSRTGRRVGGVFSANTVGTVLGAGLTGLALMPLLGLPWVFGLGIAVNAVIGVVILARGAARRRLLAWIGLPLLVFGIVSYVGWRFESTWQGVLTQGLWRKSPPESMAEVRRWAEGNEILYHKDGAGASVTVNSHDPGENAELSLRVNGKVDASAPGDMLTQLLLGHIPLLLHSGAEDVLVVGLGSGVTCGAVLRHGSVKRLDVVEISPEVVEASRFFQHANDDALNDGRLHLTVEDAKSFLKLTERKYDVISSEPSNPWMAGVSGVFSKEYYEDCRRRLNLGGLMAQWVQLYETNNEALQMILATFSAVFPHIGIWMGMDSDLILIGSARPVFVDWEDLEARFSQPRILEHLEQVNLLRFPVFLAAERVSQANGYFTTPDDAPIHTDEFPRLEYLAQRGFFEQRTADFWIPFDELYSPRPMTLLGQYLSNRPLEQQDFHALAAFFLEHKTVRPEYLRTLLAEWLERFPNDPLAWATSAQLADYRDPWESEVLFLSGHRGAIIERASSNPDLLRRYAKYLLQHYRSLRSAFHLSDAGEVEFVLEQLIRLDPPFQRVYRMHMAELACGTGATTNASLNLPNKLLIRPPNGDRSIMILTSWRLTALWPCGSKPIGGGETS